MVEFDVYEFAPLDRARPIVAAGPWLGEVGVAMMRWAPYLRALASAGWQVACGGLTGHEPIYEDFAAQYWGLAQKDARLLLGSEQIYNDGVLHVRWQEGDLRAECARKGYVYPAALHREIAAAFDTRLSRLEGKFVRVVQRMGPQRRFAPPRGRANDREVARAALLSWGVDRFLMFLPRRRAVQAEARTWPIETYLEFVVRLSAVTPRWGIAILGSGPYEADFACRVDRLRIPRTVNLIGESLAVQLGFWQIASMSTGPPSGGLCPSYLLGVPILHWEKPGQPALRKGQPWRTTQEPAFTAAAGVVSEWALVGDDFSGGADLIARLQRAHDLACRHV